MKKKQVTNKQIKSKKGFNPNSKFIESAVSEFLKRGGRIDKVETDQTFYQDSNIFGQNDKISEMEER